MVLASFRAERSPTLDLGLLETAERGLPFGLDPSPFQLANPTISSLP